jgi:hypothetical protein
VLGAYWCALQPRRKCTSTPPPPLFIAHDVVFKHNISYSETCSILYHNEHGKHIEEATVVGNVCLGGARWLATAFALPRLVTTAFFDKQIEDILEIHIFYFFSTCIKYIDF